MGEASSRPTRMKASLLWKLLLILSLCLTSPPSHGPILSDPNLSQPSRFRQREGWRLHVWNVGQGQWATIEGPELCDHFDFGGERFPREVEAHCRGKLNRLFLSHADRDHWSFLPRMQRTFSLLCRAAIPETFFRPHLKRRLESIPACPSRTHWPRILWQPGPNADRNSESWVYESQGVLFPGDSTRSQEVLWSSKVPRTTEVLLLGHHGSQSSNGWVLLTSLRHLKMAVASARRQRYGHPHPSVQDRLKKLRVPLLATEIWGHLHWELSNRSAWLTRSLQVSKNIE